MAVFDTDCSGTRVVASIAKCATPARTGLARDMVEQLMASLKPKDKPQ